MPFKSKINWELEKQNILFMGEKHRTYQEIANHYGVSKQRIKQVCDKLNIHPTLIGKKSLKGSREAEYRKKWGNKNGTAIYDQQREKYRLKKANATRAGVEFNINFGDIVWNTHCPMLGIELDYFASGRKENMPTFDRIDSLKGYVHGNVQIISMRANRIKNDSTVEELCKIADYMRNLI
jgi:hypothetical protein